MTTNFKITQPNLLKPISVQDVKQHLNVSFDADDELIAEYINAANRYILDTYRFSTVPQEFETRFEASTSGWFMLPVRPVISVEEVTGADLLDTNTHAKLCTVHIASPKPPFYVRYMAGQDPLSPAVRQALLLLVGHFFENREAVLVGPQSSVVPMGVESLMIREGIVFGELG